MISTRSIDPDTQKDNQDTTSPLNRSIHKICIRSLFVCILSKPNKVYDRLITICSVNAFKYFWNWFLPTFRIQEYFFFASLEIIYSSFGGGETIIYNAERAGGILTHSDWTDRLERMWGRVGQNFGFYVRSCPPLTELDFGERWNKDYRWQYNCVIVGGRQFPPLS